MPALTQEQLDHFHTKGYVVVEDVVPDEVLDPLEDEYAMVLDSLANELFEDGVISSTYAGLPFSDRLTRVYQDSGTVHSGYFDFSMPQGEIRERHAYVARPRGVQHAYGSPDPRRRRVDHRPGDILQPGAARPP